jgi:hypothetical protein
MARRKKATRRRTRSFSILGAVESYAYASIITNGLFDASVTEFLFAGDNVTDSARALTPSQTQTYFMDNPRKGATYGANPLSLRELINNPEFAANAVIGRGRANALNMAMQAATVSISMRLFKRLLRRPLSNIQRNLIKPAIGAGVRLA